MDVSKPSIKQVSDFFVHLFQDLNRHSSTIDGYRTAILDYLGPTGLHIAQSTDLNKLLASFHQDRPKATRNIPKWNLSVVLNELTKKPFEPMKDSDIKQLTLKTAFLLALTSGKCRTLIHILQERAFNRPATMSSWLKQTILLCYKQADQQALDLVQVKAHDIRAFSASKAFYGGVSVDQIMQACHWKAHNTFANFYLKDLTWADNDSNLYLSPVVAAQQVLDLSPQRDHLRKKKRGGGGGGGGQHTAHQHTI